MARKPRIPTFDQILDSLRAHAFDVAPFSGGGMLVSKQGAAAVLAPTPSSSSAAAATFAVLPGVLVGGEVARLVDRGYQKFLKNSLFEIPATARQLQAIHAFSEELNLLIGSLSFYNESLGTTSDVYRYDRLKGREIAQPVPARPWDSTAGH